MPFYVRHWRCVKNPLLVLIILSFHAGGQDSHSEASPEGDGFSQVCFGDEGLDSCVERCVTSGQARLGPIEDVASFLQLHATVGGHGAKLAKTTYSGSAADAEEDGRSLVAMGRTDPELLATPATPSAPAAAAASVASAAPIGARTSFQPYAASAAVQTSPWNRMHIVTAKRLLQTFLMNLPRPLPQQLWTNFFENSSSSDEPGNSFEVLVLTIACIGGAMHGLAMALKKKYGEGKEQYWLEWRWWVALIVDGCAGCLIWPAMPFISVHVLVPLIIVMQLCSSYVLGLVLFREKNVMLHNVGLICAGAGVIGVSLSASHEAPNFAIADFWAAWMAPHFIMLNLVVVVTLSGCFALVHRSTFWALFAAAFEGVQYICSRSIVDSIFHHQLGFLKQPAVLVAIAVKVLCIVSIIHSSQLGLDADLSKFAGIYLVSCTLFTCIYGVCFFGDEIPLSVPFAASAISTLAGIWFLNQSVDDAASKNVPREEVVGNPQDAQAL